jgi:hypothetical protein
MTDPGFNAAQLRIVDFCAIECRLQQSGEESVARMVRAWVWALRRPEGYRPTSGDIETVGTLVEPFKNRRGFRQLAVRVGTNIKPDWRLVPDMVERLVGYGDDLTPAQWFRQYEEIHPFVDGNGRSGQIWFNLFNGTLTEPEWAPDFWDDPRRTPGYGA